MKKLYTSPVLAEERLTSIDIFAASGNESDKVDENNRKIREMDDVEISAYGLFG